MQECIELYRVWVAFGVGFLTGVFAGVLALSILIMAREAMKHGRVGWNPDIMSLEKVNGPKSYVADQLPRPVERRIVMDNAKLTGSIAIR